MLKQTYEFVRSDPGVTSTSKNAASFSVLKMKLHFLIAVSLYSLSFLKYSGL